MHSAAQLRPIVFRDHMCISRSTRHVNRAIPPGSPEHPLAPLVAGKRFECTSCGDCCTGSNADVWLNDNEALAIAKFLDISLEDFLDQYCKKYNKRPGWRLLKSKGPNHDCIFLKDKLCTIYGARPLQCSTYPWWPELMADANWRHEAKFCEGIHLDDDDSDVPVFNQEEALEKLSAAVTYFDEFEEARIKSSKKGIMKWF